MIYLTMALPLVAVSTAATAIFIGLGFLSSPSIATRWWAAAFTTVMVTSYTWVTSEMLGLASVRAIGVGLMLGAAALMWAGARSYASRHRGNVALSVIFLVLAPLVLFLASFTTAYATVFRVFFVAAALFAAATIVELMRLGSLLRHDVLPMVAGSALFLTFAVLTTLDGILVMVAAPQTTDAMQTLRLVNLVGLTAFVVCNLVTTLLLARRSAPQSTTTPTDGLFYAVARDRLRRADAVNDDWWSVVDIRLDDPDVLRSAATPGGFAWISARLRHDVTMTLSADSDIQQVDDTHFVALIPRAQGSVREVLSTLLTRVSEPDPDQPLPVRFSVSIGWAQVTTTGYDLDKLLAAASDAALVAQREGGDRWERVRGTTV